ncbi:hypothetical protein E2C01_030598 [Portunus trituberculatus]|uniref:Uncharacterized protein n=1 Tax=Portunus trituberculatus TaxID=210409 RepID=A0A5B7EW68_PORTR|nr:hypothetical protein [Portunus trituberculatus]
MIVSLSTLAQSTHPFLLYPVNEVLLVWVISVMHNEGLEPTCGLGLDLKRVPDVFFFSHHSNIFSTSGHHIFKPFSVM